MRIHIICGYLLRHLNSHFIFVQVSEVSARSLFLENLETRQSEENAIVHSLFTYFGNKLLMEDKALFSKAVDGVFAHSVLMSVATEGDSQLIDEIKEHLRANGLQVKQEVVSKVYIMTLFKFYVLSCYFTNSLFTYVFRIRQANEI